MIVFFSILLVAYCLMLIMFIIDWLRILKENKPGPVGQTAPFITVVVPVRNEKENILFLLDDLKRQDYPSEKFEVIVIDDQSDDGTREQVSSVISIYGFSLKLLELPHFPTPGSTKKKAIQTGVDHARGEYILITDGDCRVPYGWISSYARIFRGRDINFAAGMVAYYDEKNFFQKLQSAEFAVLTGIGASSLRLGVPNMCNAANMSFRKQAFTEVGGYGNVDHIVSGDDGFLLEKFNGLDRTKVLFNIDPSAVVRTFPQRTLVEFYHQRKRWASKWKHHKTPYVAGAAIFIFALNLGLLAVLGLVLAGHYPVELFLLQILAKSSFELAFVSILYDYLGKKMKFAIFIALEAIYPFYAVFFGICANWGGFRWKGRKYEGLSEGNKTMGKKYVGSGI